MTYTHNKKRVQEAKLVTRNMQMKKVWASMNKVIKLTTSVVEDSLHTKLQ